MSSLLRSLPKSAAAGNLKWRSYSTLPALSPVLTNSLESIAPCQVTVLENGLKIATQHTNFPTATVGVFAESGTRFETPGYHGASNFIEHLMFRGTKTRSAQQVRDELAKMGVRCSMSTSREICSVEMQCLAKDVDSVVSNLGDVVTNPKFDAKDVDAEKDVIMRQVQAQNFNYRDWVMDYLHSCSYMGTPLENNILGLTDTIIGMRPEDIQMYHKNNWITPRMVVVAVGPFGHDHMVDLVKKHFADTPTHTCDIAPYQGPSRFTSAEIEYRDDSMPMSYGGFTFETCGFSHPDVTPLAVAQACVGNWSRVKDGMGQHINHWRNQVSTPLRYEGMNRVFHTDCFNIHYRDNGLFGCYLEMEDLDIAPYNNLHYLIRDELVRLALFATDEETEIAKENLKHSLIRDETCDGTKKLASIIGRDVLYGGTKKSLLQKVQEIEKITSADIRDVMDRRIYDMDCSYTKIGKVEAWPEMVMLRMWTTRWLL